MLGVSWDMVECFSFVLFLTVPRPFSLFYFISLVFP